MNAPRLPAGPVSQHAAALARRWVNQHGIAVWLDLDEHYTGLVDRLADAHEVGEFSIPVVRFRGSFLDLMLELRAHGQGRHPQPLLVHMPGFNEARIHRTPALELYRAGSRFRVALETVIREAAVGKVTPKVLDDYVSQGELSLEDADEWLRAASAVASGELGAWLEQVEPTTVLQALLSARASSERFGASDAEGRVRDWFERRLGVDAAWHRFCRPIDDAHAAADGSWRSHAHLAPITHALCVEYVYDLHREPVMPELQALKRLPAPLVEANQEVARWFREDHANRYESLANDLEGRVAPETEDDDPEALGEIDTFRFEEARLMRAALTALEDDAWDKALRWSEGRSERASFWARRSPPRRTAWRLIARAARLGAALSAAVDHLDTPWHTQDDAMNAYARLDDAGAWRVDAAHRAMESEIATHWDARLPHYALLQQRIQTLRDAYRDWADRLARKAATLCEERGPLPSPPARLRGVFRRSVRALLDAHPRQRTAFFLLDGFRYELAAALLPSLADERGVDAQLSPRMAPGPSDTWLCMNALALDQDGTQPIEVHSVGTGVRAGAFVIRDPETRRRAMREATGLPSVVGLTIDATLDLPAEALSHKVRSSRLTVVHSAEPDKAGEAGNGLRMFDRILAMVRSAITRLREAGVQHFVVTSDHGFLLHHPDTWQRVPFGKKTDPARRVALHPAPAREPYLLTMQPRQLELRGIEDTLVFPRSTALFDQGRHRKNYAHGGMSLQERVIPVLQVTHRNPKGGSTLRYTLDVTPLSPLPGMSRLKATLRVDKTGMLSFGGDEALDLALRVPDRPDIDVDIIECDGATTVGGLIRARVDQEFRLFLRLTGPRDEKARLQVHDPGGDGRLEPVAVEGWFEALGRADERGGASDTSEQPAPQQADDDWLDSYDDDGVRAIFAHIHQHGSITEAECTQFLGSPRKFRRFSRHVERHAAEAPFDLRVEHAASGKRYVRDGVTP